MLHASRFMFYLVLDNIRSGHNVGSIFRTADAFGVDKIFLCGITPAITHKEVKKTALGAENFISSEKCYSVLRLVKNLKNQGLKIYALEQLKNSIKLVNFNPIFPCALVVGNEIKGVNKQVLKIADKIIEIPMVGKKESLNVSVAAGIAIYHIKTLNQKS